ncbi:Peptidase M43B, pregnancy-associated plasma-A [Cordyceps militaris CM01]|uniref:Peptidase M43B, pregnancy-associated plasma-A n=1 Tax=Cordyceps militaris (strain CM01) TaxID=983644 RepID=G3JSV9_CORMM|nr:Peptidase M43B, pregnancy-associated plasma-A [Cordyceps militaris CM01]EGX88955.1 Peptidase M43B, pregnancy-associated plasma-A [Cordyceps militaris CM01]
MLPVFLSLLTLAWANTLGRRSSCHSADPSHELLTVHSNLATGELVRRAPFPESVTIETYVHIFAENKTYEGGWLSNNTIERQIQVLNQGYSSTPFKFALKGIDRNVTLLPTNPRVEPQVQFKLQYRKGDYRSLNLYYVSGIFGGQCTFPSLQASLDNWAADFYLDGCTMGADTTPGSSGLFGAGTTTIHEVGHWLGLLHTFRGGCNSTNGDYIDDTPVEADFSADKAIFDTCPVGRDSCPGLPGLDPIQNYMDYASEDCRTEFTPGQIDRMKSLWALVRNIEPGP